MSTEAQVPNEAHPVFAYLRGENRPSLRVLPPAASTGCTASGPDSGTGPLCPGTQRPSRTGAASTERRRRHQTWGPHPLGRQTRREEAVQGRAWSVPFGATAVSFRRSWARGRDLVFGNQGRAEHQWRQDLFAERPADRGASLPLRGRLPKGSAPEPQRRQRTGRANLGGEAWGEAGDTTFSLEPPLASRRGAGGCDREAEKDQR
jgi:hypothetical protein